MTLVTTARLTRAENCSLSEGDMVIRARPDWAAARMIMPITGAPRPFTFEKKGGIMRSSEADLAVWAMVNCQPSREPRQAKTARAMTMLPMVGLNIWAKARAKGPVEAARSEERRVGKECRSRW